MDACPRYEINCATLFGIFLQTTYNLKYSQFKLGPAPEQFGIAQTCGDGKKMFIAAKTTSSPVLCCLNVLMNLL